MKTLIAYATKYGTSETCAKLLADALQGEAELVNLAHGEAPSPAFYEAVIVGGSIYAGQLRKAVRKFCKKYKQQLLHVRFGCFLCEASAGEYKENLENNFDGELLAHASAKSCFGGEIQAEKLGAFDKLILGAIARRRAEVSPPHIDKEKIRSFALAMSTTDKDFHMEG